MVKFYTPFNTQDLLFSSTYLTCITCSTLQSRACYRGPAEGWHRSLKMQTVRFFNVTLLAELHAREARAWAEPHSLVNLPIPENLVIT